ncbi:M20/M25/M40 family metallo-hydrolase [Curtobacterium sp. MCBD17_019]|uniref:M20/M25/M40 family metallo-hydrolase n=1 Tax=Curtobacterium sp. MCBD17_019 TaxID=2175669 RepID=UPI000DA97872|nr:M20/M25/M40 family metallo-hydrolase [Curtobacterium sp. MCBD17_019]PZE75695.1 peptidase M20 [Curtobacterium sp. MCBD17_019]
MSATNDTTDTASNDIAITDTDATEVVRFLAEHRQRVVDELSAWVAIPSVGALPERAIDVERSAHWLAGELRAIGFTTELLRAGPSVAVYAEWQVDPALPTVLVYSHHDVRDAKPEEWKETAPFAPVFRDGRLYGRGASDAKGQMIAHLWGLRAHLATRPGGLPAVNFRVIVEGEEELGSTHFADLIETHRDRFACDVVVFSDTLQWKQGNPAVVTSMRGMTGATLTITGPERDVHSGAASGPTPNPVHVLVDVLGRLHDDDGRIALPGFYDDVEELTDERRRELEDLSFDTDVWLERTETRSVTGERGFTVEERLWARPSLEILSVLAGDPTGVSRAVIPSQATAELSIRTVPGQHVHTVAEQVRAFFDEHIPDSVVYELSIPEESGQDPYVTPSGPALDALDRAMARGHGTPTAGRMGNAGGGPAELLGRELDVPVLFVGTGLPEDHWHSSDESIDLEMLVAGAASIAHLWTELGASIEPERS